MTKAMLDGFRKQLTSLSDRIRNETRQLRAELPLRSANDEPGTWPTEVPIDSAELSAHHSEEDVVLTIVGGEETLLREINAAIGRIDTNTFGRCETCGKPIPRERLRAVPHARFCIQCSG